MESKVKLDENRLLIFHEARKRRTFVGELIYSPTEDQYELIYDKGYVLSKKAIPVGPELNLFNLHHKSAKGKLFSSFVDRIPLKSNPAYQDYCKSQGISPEEKNPIILLTSIGARGPSSFVFESAYKNEFSIIDVIELQKKLNITQYDFAQALDFSPLTLQKLESGKSHDLNTLKRLQIYLEFPTVALWQLKQTGARINHEAFLSLVSYFSSKNKEPFSPNQAIFSEAVTYAKQNDFFSYQKLLKKIQKQTFLALKEYRKQYTNHIDKKEDLPPIMDKFINIASPLFLCVFASYLSSNKEKAFVNVPQQLIFDLLTMYDWKTFGGSSIFYNIPEFLTFVFHYIYGALNIDNNTINNIFSITQEKFPTYIEQEKYEYLYNIRPITGWVESLGRDCFDSFKYIFDAYQRWDWIKILFDDEEDFKKALVCYQSIIILINYFDSVKNNYLGTLDTLRAVHVPPSAAMADYNIKEYANNFLIKNRMIFKSYLMEKNISEKDIEEKWELWLGKIREFRSPRFFDLWLFHNNLMKNIIG